MAAERLAKAQAVDATQIASSDVRPSKQPEAQQALAQARRTELAAIRVAAGGKEPQARVYGEHKEVRDRNSNCVTSGWPFQWPP